jgi:hypothetical protein
MQGLVRLVNTQPVHSNALCPTDPNVTALYTVLDSEQGLSCNLKVPSEARSQIGVEQGIHLLQ